MKKTIAVLLFMTVLLSCMKDLGNYEYRDIRAFQITGVESRYSVSISDRLRIDARTDLGKGEYSAVWFMELKETSGTEVETYADTISRELVLDVPFKYTVGTYTLHLKVTDRQTGVSKYAQTTISAVTRFYEGYYILKETPSGDTEMDFHTVDGEVVEDLLTTMTGAPLEGAPKTLSYLNDYSYLDEKTGQNVVGSLIIPLSEKELRTLSLLDMSQIRTHSQWFFEEQNAYPVEKIHHFNNLCFCYGMFTENGLFTNYQCAFWEMYSTGKLSTTPNIMSDGTMEYASSADVCYFEGAAYCHDPLNDRFNYVDMNGTCVPVQLSSGGDELVFLGGIRDEKNNLVAVYERQDGSRYWKYLEADENKFILVHQGDFGSGAVFEAASGYAVCRMGGTYLYALSGQDIYALNPANGYNVKLQFAGKPGGEISYFDTMFMVTEDGSGDYNHFVMAVQEGDNYSIAFYDMIGGEPISGQGPVRVLKGKGRVKTLQHTSPQKQSNGVGTSSYSLHY